MRRTLVFVAALLFLSIVLVSCKSTENCPAYGESKKFQVEQEY